MNMDNVFARPREIYDNVACLLRSEALQHQVENHRQPHVHQQEPSALHLIENGHLSIPPLWAHDHKSISHDGNKKAMALTPEILKIRIPGTKDGACDHAGNQAKIESLQSSFPTPPHHESAKSIVENLATRIDWQALTSINSVASDASLVSLTPPAMRGEQIALTALKSSAAYRAKIEQLEVSLLGKSQFFQRAGRSADLQTLLSHIHQLKDLPISTPCLAAMNTMSA